MNAGDIERTKNILIGNKVRKKTGFRQKKPKYLTIVNSHVVMVIHYEGSFLL